MRQFIGCDVHKKFSLFVALNEKGEASRPVRVAHDRETMRDFLRQLPPNTCGSRLFHRGQLKEEH